MKKLGKAMSKRPWKQILLLAVMGSCVWSSVLLYDALTDRKLMATATAFVGRDFEEMVAEMGPPGSKLETVEDYERFSLKPTPHHAVYVYSGHRGVACVVVDEERVVRQVLRRPSPP